ncbi:cholecystokinin receptor type A-like [Saccostrea echinata]|uniref:cholecystokinin receptor type A-like n=1 Tax=Saccostrea echinata TaxID=191078 RepID=UPI002A7FD6A9|nr:cholecystokinin receptor type A-like [Saccostrea echinata]
MFGIAIMANDTKAYEHLLQAIHYQRALGSTIGSIIGAVIGVIGNSFVVLVYLFRIKEKGERYFIPLLAIVDLSACLTTPPFFILDNSYFYNYPSNVWCKILSFFLLCFSTISANMLLVISLQRHLLVCKPFGPKMTLFWKRVSFLSSCCIGLLCSVPVLKTAGILQSNSIYMNHSITTRVCKFSMYQSLFVSAYFAFLLILSIANILVTLFLYIPILHRIKRSRPWKSNAADKKEILKQENEHSCSSVTFQAAKKSEVIQANTSKNEPNFADRVISTEENKTACKSAGETDPGNPSARTATDLPTTLQQKMKKVHKRPVDRFSIMFFIIILTYVLSYIAPLVILVLTYTIEDFDYVTLSETDSMMWIYLPRLVFINHILNPFVYGYFDTKFKDQLKIVFCRYYPNKNLQ